MERNEERGGKEEKRKRERKRVMDWERRRKYVRRNEIAELTFRNQKKLLSPGLHNRKTVRN